MKNMRLCITHISRPMDFAQCSLNYLTRRFGASDRLRNPPPLHSLRDASDSGYIGNVTIWDLGAEPTKVPRLERFIRRDFKAQHALLDGERLLICGTEHLEICGGDGRVIRSLTDPWFSGGHTLCSCGEGRIAITCSAPDAVLVFDVEGGKAEALQIPRPFYGRNYDLRRDEDLHAHYINNDLQRTHINCAVPFAGGFLVSLMIPGAVGVLGYDGSYRELISGFVGCHGARVRPDREGFYFSDSCTGTLVEVDGLGRISRRFAVESRWLHDCQWAGDDLYVFCVADSNMVELWDIASARQVWSLNMNEYGATTQFVSIAG
jgi:hypothetical protein